MDCHLASGSCALELLLAEPDAPDELWIVPLVRRLLAADLGPVAGPVEDAALRARVEEAGWLTGVKAADAEAARRAAWPAHGTGLPGVGSLRPRVVLLGEAQPRAGWPPWLGVAGAWAFRTLRLLGWDELAVRALNSVGLEDAAAVALRAAFPDAVWVAAGDPAAALCARLGVPACAVKHPQWHRRFRRAEGHAGYARLLREAGVPPGPWFERPLPVVACAEAPSSVPPLPDLPRSAAPSTRVGRGVATHVAREKLEAARAFYETAEARTVADAARRAAIAEGSIDDVRKVARRERWEDGRRAYLRQLADETRTRALEAESKGLADGKRLTWLALTGGAQDVLLRIRAALGDENAMARLESLRAIGDEGATPLHCTPGQLKALASVASLLGESTEQDLGRMSLAELAKVVREGYRRMGR